MGALHAVLIRSCRDAFFDLSKCSPGQHLTLGPLSFFALVFFVDHIFDASQVEQVEVEAILNDHLCLADPAFQFCHAEQHRVVVNVVLLEELGVVS